ncbi:putative major facilitator superfamily transporter [Rosellinia necatrix]|uniref:Putative major facilitator superfamily transporter n=1 Tax=Rosellinia necatrix TaxID=77044 RepID=A0A1S7UJS8_ROSNE|nr:putative major facilitator superfamily transporter [Rosellinia necatrix]
MTYNGQQAGETRNEDDQPDEHTCLLRHGRDIRHETVTPNAGDRGTEQDMSRVCGGPGPTPALEVSPEEGIRENEDEDEEDGEDEPQRFLVDTEPRRFRVLFGGIMLTYFMANVDSTILASSHPVITSHFGASQAASWLTTAFLLTSTAFQPLAGRLSDALGRRAPYVACVAVFAAATVWCALAPGIASFIAARAVCGLGAGGMITLGAIAISDCVPIERRGTYQSIINIVYGMAAASGAAFGGLLADTLGWRWEFGIQVLPLALCLAASTAMPADLGLPRRRGGREPQKRSLAQALRGFDFAGSALLTMSTTFLILGLNLGGNILPWSHPFVIASLAIFGVCFPACLYVERSAERPIMPLALLHSSPRANIIFSNFICSFLLNAILFNVPLFIRAVLLKSATQSGLYLLVPTVVASATGAATGLLITRTGRLAWPLLSGAVLFAAGSAVLAAQRRAWPAWACLAALAPFAAGQGLQFPGSFVAVLAASPPRDQAVVTAALQLWRSLGNVLGVAGSSLVFQNALLRCLRAFVVPAPPGPGEDGEAWKRDLVERVRSNIEAVSQLPDGPTKDQVVMSYEAACRATFLVCVGVALIGILLLLPVRLPRLGRKQS